jgi:hypothetical protein
MVVAERTAGDGDLATAGSVGLEVAALLKHGWVPSPGRFDKCLIWLEL